MDLRLIDVSCSQTAPVKKPGPPKGRKRSKEYFPRSKTIRIYNQLPDQFTTQGWADAEGCTMQNAYSTCTVLTRYGYLKKEKILRNPFGAHLYTKIIKEIIPS